MAIYANGKKVGDFQEITIGEDGHIGIGAALERIEFNGTGGYINILGANVGLGVPDSDETLEVIGNIHVSDTDGSSLGKIQFGDDINRFIRGNSAEFQTGVTFTTVRMMNTGASTIESNAADGITALKLNARTSHASGNILEVTNAGVFLMAVDFDGKVGMGVTLPLEKLHVDDAIALSNDAEGSTGRITRRSSHETHTLANASTSDTTTISIPDGARIIGVSMTVNTTVVDSAGDDTWSAAFITGSTTTIVSGAAAAQNTKVNFLVLDEKSSGIAQIRFTANGGNFTAGVIEVVAYYEELTSLAN